MKQWNITVTAENEEKALKLVNVLSKALEMSIKVNEPLHHVYADDKKNKIECEENRNFKK